MINNYFYKYEFINNDIENKNENNIYIQNKTHLFYFTIFYILFLILYILCILYIVKLF